MQAVDAMHESATLPVELTGHPNEIGRVLAAEHSQPHNLLGGHPAHFAGSEGTVIRAFHPDAVAASVLRPDQPPTTSG